MTLGETFVSTTKDKTVKENHKMVYFDKIAIYKNSPPAGKRMHQWRTGQIRRHTSCAFHKNKCMQAIDLHTLCLKATFLQYNGHFFAHNFTVVRRVLRHLQ